MTDTVTIRVTMDGKEARRELVVNGEKVADLSYVDVLNLIANAASGLRFGERKA